MTSAFISLTIMGFVLGGALSLAARLMRVESNPLADDLESILPGLQCGQCGYPGCRGAAEALSKAEAEITLCPPGGSAIIEILADKLQIPFDVSGFEIKQPEVALIIEDECIGCTKCIQVCGTDAIIGANKLMHTVIPEACTGCDKCVEACPVDCIKMIPKDIEPPSLGTWHWPKPGAADMPVMERSLAS
jgi:electron transport complex protein RnfB